MSATDRRDTIDAGTPGEGLESALKKYLRNLELETYVAGPAQVVSYSPATQTAQLLWGYLPVEAKDTPAGEVEIPYPPMVIPAARVLILQGSTHYDQPPILPGDTGLCLVCDRALDQWYLQGGNPVDPIDGRAHDPADAVFLPGLAPDALRSAPALNPAARTIDAPIIALGSGALPAVGSVALAQALHTYLVAMWTAIVPIALDGGASLKATGLAYLAANPFTAFATTKVLAE